MRFAKMEWTEKGVSIVEEPPMSTSERLSVEEIEAIRLEYVLTPRPTVLSEFPSATRLRNILCDMACALRALDSDNALSFTVAQADCILKCRDALIAREYDEVWHQLYMLQTKQSNYDPFAPWINLEILVQNADNAAGRDHQPVESEFPPSQAPVPAAPEPGLVNADECLWIIYYEDKDAKPEVFSHAGARLAAEARYAQAQMNWNCTLLVDAAVLRSAESRVRELAERFNIHVRKPNPKSSP